MVGVVFACSISMTVIAPTTQMQGLNEHPSEEALKKVANYGTENGWRLDDPFLTGNAGMKEVEEGFEIHGHKYSGGNPKVAKGKTIFIREGCWWCHTVMPEVTQDWQYFGAPPDAHDFVYESPTVIGSDRKAPDLLHVGSRYVDMEDILYTHFWRPQNVMEASIMPHFNYLWGDKDADGNPVDLSADEEPTPADDSDVVALVAYIESLK
jgi:cytochrome c oxidase cbb3-type subunit 2